MFILQSPGFFCVPSILHNRRSAVPKNRAKNPESDAWEAGMAKNCPEIAV
ncbi:MAG: hypothetical protein ABSC26_00305 [Stellaceae bacterium]|jgi:hypothetical protein